VLLLGLACRPCLRLQSWDHTVIPLPFGRGALVWDGPFGVDNASREALAAAREDLQARLSAATGRSEAMLA
jgi:lysophospholipid acyltransferase (LPLAT)-like uncharacterized protein